MAIIDFVFLDFGKGSACGSDRGWKAWTSRHISGIGQKQNN